MNYFETQPNAFLVVPIILPNIPQQETQNNPINSNNLSFGTNFATDYESQSGFISLNQSEFMSLSAQNEEINEERENHKDSIDKFLAF